MRHNYYYLIFGLFLLFGCSFDKLTKAKRVKPELSNSEETKKSKYDEALGLAAWEFELTKDPATNTVPRQKILDAIAFEKNRKQKTTSEAAISNMTWTERGPNNVGGRTRAIMVDPNDATKKTIWAGSVSGGLWKTTDITATSPDWTSIDDLFSNMSITTLAYDSTNNDTMYFGTGEGWFNSDAVKGFGIWRTLNQGATWTQLASTTGTNFNYVNKIVVHPTNHNIYVATRAGLFRSTDYGASFTSIGPNTNNVSDIELSSTGRIHIGVGSLGVTREYHYSDNDGTTWDPSAHNFTSVVGATGKRVELAIAPSLGSTLYAIVGTTSAIEGIYKSTNSGITWAATTAASWVDQACGSSAADFTRNQSWYDLAMAVNPSDPDNVIIGGVDLLKTTNGGTSWTQITSWWGGCSRQDVHADQHVIYFEPGSSTVAYFGNDGGIYRTTNATAATPTLTSKNDNYNVTQYYSTSLHPTAFENYIIGGAQDNGTHIIESAGIGSGNEVTGGDGGFCHIETDEPQYVYSSYVYNNFYRSSDYGSTFSTLISDNNGPFITPWDFDNTNNILYASYTTNNIVRWSSMHGTPSGATINIASSGTFTHIKVSPNTPTTIYGGTNSGKLYKITSANGTPSTTDITGASFPAGSISCLEVEKGNEAHLLATFSNFSVTSVWESTNSGSTWTSVEGNLPDLPVRWVIFNPNNYDQALLATETGVYSTDNLNGGSTDWGINSTGMPNVRVDMLKLRASDSFVVAATHGRGIFTSDVFCGAQANFEANKTIVYFNQSIQFSDNSHKATSWAWDFDNNGSTDATTQNPIWAYGTAGYKTVKLTINAGAKSLTRTSYILVLPNLATPFTLAQGGNFESNADYFASSIVSGSTNLWELGAPGNYLNNARSSSKVWKTLLNSDITEGDYKCVLQTPNFNFEAAGTYSVSFYRVMEIRYSNAPLAVWMEYSTDLGENWTRLGAYSGNPSGTTHWYTTETHSVAPGGICWSFNSASASSWNNAVYNASALAGNKNVTFRFVALCQSGWTGSPNPYAMDGFSIDDFTITCSNSNAVNTGVETTATSKSENFGPSATVDFYSSNGNILATLVNNSAHDYGLTTVSIDNTGTGGMNYSTNTVASQRIFQKTYTISPTTNNGSGSYTVKFYFDDTEVSGWKSVTGNNFSGANMIKCPGNIASGTLANGIYGSSPVKALYGASDSSITASFTTGFSGFGVGIDVSVLPVELIQFNATKLENNVLLTWATASEKNNSGFEIERSYDASNWNKIAFVASNGNMFSKTNYTHIDEKALENKGLLYYRLKQLDDNGSFKYSEIRVVENLQQTVTVNLSPQPAKELLQVSTSLEHGFNYTIVTSDGKEILRGEQRSKNASIQLRTLPAGVYYLVLYVDSRNISSQRFVKVE
jgi:hypothetical protein